MTVELVLPSHVLVLTMKSSETSVFLTLDLRQLFLLTSLQKSLQTYLCLDYV